MESPIEEAFEILSSMKNDLSKEYQGPIYLAYAAIYKKTENKLLRAIALEKAVEIDPSNTYVIFEAALAQSEAGLSALAITNYESLLRQNPDNSAALNNLGVEFDGLQMPILAVNSYNESSKRHETLAMSNIAYKYIGQGLITDAEELLKKAQQEKEVHPNVLDSMASISKQKNSETEKKERINQVGIKQKAFLKDYADSRFTHNYQEGIFNGKWKYDSEIITIEEKDKTISAEWGKAPNKKKFKGEVNGNSANITFENQIAWLTTSESFSKGNDALCYINANRKTIHIMTLSKEKPEFIDLTLENQ